MVEIEEIDHIDDWASFYKETVSHKFVLPVEAQVVEAKEDIFGSFLVRFKLPHNKSPEKWIKKIALDSKINPKYKKNKFLYECRIECLDIKLQYFLDHDIYLAVYAND